MSIKRDIELLFEIGCFRFIQRNWKRFLNPNVQNNAEHTLRVAWIALTLAHYEKTSNKEKILKMALIHDLPESRCGDVDYISRQYTHRDEQQATKNIFHKTIHQQEAIQLFQDYQDRRSLEAQIVKDADNLDVELELIEQKARGHTIGNIWNKNRRQLVHPRLYTDSAKKFLREILKSNPHDWHLNAKNRFNQGDWMKKD